MKRERESRLCALVLAAVLAAASARAETPGAFVRRAIEEWSAHTHLSRDLVDADALAHGAEERRAAGASPEALVAWLARQLRRAEVAFAPAGAKHDPAARYSLPFEPRIPRLMSQGPGGAESHGGRQREAFDFVMPAGTPVLAAREGVVGQVVDGFTAGGRDSHLRENHVYVVHADGTFAQYAHLSPGIPVRAGQPVARGDELGKSGSTGNSTAPHLHFAVARVDPDGFDATTVPIRFGRPGGPGFVPRKNDFVGFPPKPNLPLVVSAGGRVVSPGEALRVRRGDRLPIGVTRRQGLGDLVGDPRLELVSMTPWNLSVEGRVAKIEPMPGFPWDLVPGLSDVAVLGVYFLDPGQGEIGLGQLELRIARDPSTGAAP